MKVLVLNCGSSSIKYRLFETDTETPVIKGQVECIGESSPAMTHSWEGGEASGAVAAPDHQAAMRAIHDALMDPSRGGVGDASEIAAVGHRVVHGGETFFTSAIIDDGVERVVEECALLAPLHNPPNLVGIRAARKAFPDIPHVAVFDTAFHQTMPREAWAYALPWEWYSEDGVRRYGFHGTSHRYVAVRAAELLGIAADDFTGITLHLGNGCSCAAIQNGRSVDTSMGLTPLEGLVMGTRCGDIDPAIVFHVAARRDLSFKDLDRILNKQSGLKGLSGLTNDVRELEAAAAGGHDRAGLALDVYARRVRKYIGAYLAVLDRPVAVVFTGGVGERGAKMRHRIAAGLDHLGLVFDESRNGTIDGEGDIAAEGSPVRILVVPTREELMIARETSALVATGAPAG